MTRWLTVHREEIPLLFFTAGSIGLAVIVSYLSSLNHNIFLLAKDSGEFYSKTRSPAGSDEHDLVLADSLRGLLRDVPRLLLQPQPAARQGGAGAGRPGRARQLPADGAAGGGQWQQARTGIMINSRLHYTVQLLSITYYLLFLLYYLPNASHQNILTCTKTI